MEALNWPKNRPFPLCAFQKCEFLGNARALLFPIDWPEPFGLVMIEAMAAGTPVIAWPNGSVPEIITEGVSGRIVDSIEAAVEAVQQAAHMDRRKVRAEFEKRFTAARMARAYVAAYRALLAHVPTTARQPGVAMPAVAAREVSPLAWERAKQGGGQVFNPAG
jgi:glycosyltransferase involved in cell wall biosynthesis